MKKSLQLLTIFCGILIAFSSCKSSREAMAQRKADIHQSKEATTACFVQLNDGTVKNFSSLKLVTGVLKTPYLLADGKIKIDAKDIKAYQNKEHYAISQDNFTTGRKSYVAKETLPGFAIRIAKGSINVYTKKYFNGTITVDEYFIQKGDDGNVVAYNTENMKELSKEDDSAMVFFANRKYNTPKTKKTGATDSESYANREKIKVVAPVKHK